MAKTSIQRFEDLIAWQKARLLTKDIYAITTQEKFAKDFGLSNQIQRSAVSIMANLAEGFERGSQAEFKRFVSIAKASCAELRSHLYIAEDIAYLNLADAKRLHHQAQELAKILGGLYSSIKT